MLSISKRNLKNVLKKQANIRGKNHWLFLPSDYANTKKKYICFVSHIDTVFDHKRLFEEERLRITDVQTDKRWGNLRWTNKQEIYFDNKKNVYWSPQGLGADDRAGVYASLKIKESNENQFYLFTDGEETGGAGAYESIDSLFDFKNRISFFIELDRKGGDDMVFYNNEPNKFKNKIKKLGFIERWGSFSDISILCQYFYLPGVNLSVGYYNPHTTSEYLKVDELEKTICKIDEFLKNK